MNTLLENAMPMPNRLAAASGLPPSLRAAATARPNTSSEPLP